MPEYLKVFAMSSALIGGVFTIIAVLTVAAIFLMPAGKEPASLSEDYLTVFYYQTDKDNPSVSNVTQKKSCSGSECDDLASKLNSSCDKTGNPKVIVEGYFNNKYVNKRISSGCSNFEAVKNALA